MRRAPGGRHCRLEIRLTAEEERIIRDRAGQHGLSAQRFVIESALSGSAGEAAERRRAAVEAGAARAVLKGIANNLNQMTKWANANHVLPGHFADLVDETLRVLGVVEATTVGLGARFPPNHHASGGPDVQGIP